MAILKAEKLEYGSDSQKLVSSLDPGGLWPLTESAHNIFFRSEHYFGQSVKGALSLQQVDIAGIAQKSVMISNSDVVLY